MAAMRLGALVALSAVDEIAGHGWLASPPARNVQAGPKNGYCPHCGNGNGICGDGNQWPSGSDYLNFYNGPVETWTEGSIVPVEVRVTAHHKGHYEFSICDQVIRGGLSNAQECLDKHILQRVSAEEAGVMDCKPGDERGVCQPLDPRHPERFYLPPGSGYDKIYLKLPAGLKCEACTFQWRWWSANSCIPAPDYACFKSELDANGFSSANWGLGGSCPGGSCDRCGCGEEFRNCADVSIVAGGGGGGGGVAPPTTASPSTTTMMPPVSTSTVAPTSAPSACTAVPVDGKLYGATDMKCNEACAVLPDGLWPCSADGPCRCDTPPATPSPTPVSTPAPTPPTTGGGAQCGGCAGCLWTAHSACYSDWTKDICDRYDGYEWCR
eukprot:TRINITY_DN224_c0_g1_i4.p1 TRINITY_DN224_c0_g1~~TRINITY_DN224_c0_g1_i4.p1  ORF type:complete len:402 (-),score=76.78 TRINITY_DN224_c0_g1_i4:2-1147(-)